MKIKDVDLDNLNPYYNRWIENLQANDPVIRYSKFRDKFNFNAGDYLVKFSKNWRSGKIEPEKVSSESNVNKKFLVIKKDNLGFCYISPISSKGELMPSVIPLTAWHEDCFYDLDPEYAEHLILSEGDFDPADSKKQERRRKEEITKKNKAMAIKHNGDPSILVTLYKEGKLKVGQKIWIGRNIPFAVKSPYIFNGLNANGKPMATVVRPNYNSNSYQYTHHDAYILFLEEPFSYETI